MEQRVENALACQYFYGGKDLSLELNIQDLPFASLHFFWDSPAPGTPLLPSAWAGWYDVLGKKPG